MCVANIMQPIIQDCEWNRKKVEELEKEILKLPITQTYPLARFFLPKLMNSQIVGLTY